MSLSCSAFGHGIFTDLPIAGLIGLKAAHQEDIRISLGSLPDFLAQIPSQEWSEYYLSPDLTEGGMPIVRVRRANTGRYFRIDYPDETVIVVNSQGTRIWATRPIGATVEDTATYLLGPTLGFVLRLRGITCLHASAVAIEDKVIALVGPSASGKSTMAAAFAKLGYPVLTDDLLALSDHGLWFEAQPAYPRVRLWPESVKGLFGSEDALPCLTPNWDKRFLDLSGIRYRFQHEPLPLAAIYFLAPIECERSEFRMETVQMQDAMMSLIVNTYANYLLDKSMRAKEFESLGRLVRTVQFRRIVSDMDFMKLPQICESIAKDCQQLDSHKVAIAAS